MELTKEQYATIEIVINKLARKFKFGYHEIDDIKQQARLFAIEGISKWDQIRPLENFLWTHVRNRLYNFKRDNYARPDKPCFTCPLYNIVHDSCNKYRDTSECDLLGGWLKRNDSKKGLMSNHEPINGDDAFEINYNLDKHIDLNNLFIKLDANIPIEYREDWLRLYYNLKLPKMRRLKIIEIIKELIGDDYGD